MKYAFRIIPVLILALALGFLPGRVTGQVVGVALEVWTGGAFSSQGLGNSLPIQPSGFLNLGKADPGPLVGMGVLLTPRGLGMRPHLRLSYALPSSIPARWVPCDPGYPCPAILAEPTSRTSRLEALAGVDVPLLASDGPVRPSASLGVGLRRQRVSWDLWDQAHPSLHLPAGARSDTDFFFAAGLEAAIPLSSWELVVKGTADFSRYGPGVIPPPPDILALYAGGIDLGRVDEKTFKLVIGARRPLR